MSNGCLREDLGLLFFCSRNTSRALFLAQEGAVRYATVTDYDVHPEFNEDTLNTVALLHLDYDEDKFDCKWK